MPGDIMISDRIAEIGIDGALRLYVRPARTSFTHIYRAGKDISWDPSNRRLLSPRPVEWSYLQGFNQILAATAEEYGVRLQLTPATIWSNISDELKAVIQGASS
jgi:hypothetical protein